MKHFLKISLGWAALALIIVASLAYWRSTRKPVIANVGIVSRSDLIQRVTIAGTVNPNRKTVIAAPYNGYVRKLYVQIGDHVKPGDPIVSLAQSLRGGEEDGFPLRAPFAGTVVQILKTEGEYVEQNGGQGSGNAIVRIDDLTRIFVEASAPEVEVGKLKLAQETVIKASAVLDHSYRGKIGHISLAAKEQRDWDKSRVEFPVLIEVVGPDAQLKPGMSVIVDIITAKISKVLTLRHEFIQKDSEQYFIINEQGEKKNITVGAQNEDSFEIRSGVSEGERIRQTDFLSVLKER